MRDSVYQQAEAFDLDSREETPNGITEKAFEQVSKDTMEGEGGIILPY